MSDLNKPTIINPKTDLPIIINKEEPKPEEPPKRKRGRPRIHPVLPPGPPRKRGRPRKSDAKYPTIADMKSFRRKWSMVDMMLHAPEGCSIDEMAEHFGVTSRTIRRDMKIIDDIFGGLGVNRVRWGLRRYYIEQLPFGANGKPLDKDELISICIARELMTPLEGTSLGDAMKSGAEKIRGCLSKESVEYADKVLSYFKQFRPNNSLKQNSKTLNFLLKSMDEGQGVKIRYYSARDQEMKIFEVLPYNFIYDKGVVFLAGYCCEERHARLWKLSRIRAIKSIEKRFELPKNFEVKSFSEAAVTPYLGNDEPRRVRIRFSQKVALDVEEESIAIIRRKRTLQDGSLEVEAEVDPNPSFVNWILAFGKNAEVVSPSDVRRLIFDETERVFAIYKN